MCKKTFEIAFNIYVLLIFFRSFSVFVNASTGDTKRKPIHNHMNQFMQSHGTMNTGLVCLLTFVFSDRKDEVWSEDVRNVDLGKVEDILALKRHIRKGRVCPKFRKQWKMSHPEGPPAPSAPFRAYSYTTSKVCGKSDPVSQWGTGFENKIVICDEIHRIVQDVLPSQKDAISRLRALAFHATNNTVFIGLTGSPIQNNPDDGDHILRAVRGKQYETMPNEGFVSFDLSLPLRFFPRVTPNCQTSLLTEAVLRKMVKVVDFDSHLAVEYQRRQETLKGSPDLTRTLRLQNYTNMKWFYAQALHNRSHDLLKRKYAPKLHAIATYMTKYRNEKIVICIRRRCGLAVLAHIVQKCLENARERVGIGVYSSSSSSYPKLMLTGGGIQQ